MCNFIYLLAKVIEIIKFSDCKTCNDWAHGSHELCFKHQIELNY